MLQVRNRIVGNTGMKETTVITTGTGISRGDMDLLIITDTGIYQGDISIIGTGIRI